MAHIDNVRKEIERILDMRFAFSYVDKCPTNKHPERRRVRLYPSPAGINVTQRQESQLMKIPHLIQIKSLDPGWSGSPGFSFYFDCKPSEIKIPIKS